MSGSMAQVHMERHVASPSGEQLKMIKVADVVSDLTLLQDTPASRDVWKERPGASDTRGAQARSGGNCSGFSRPGRVLLAGRTAFVKPSMSLQIPCRPNERLWRTFKHPVAGQQPLQTKRG